MLYTRSSVMTVTGYVISTTAIKKRRETTMFVVSLRLLIYIVDNVSPLALATITLVPLVFDGRFVSYG